MQFAKYSACGNDFVLIDDLDDTVELTPAAVRAICARRYGVGADGVLRVAPPRSGDEDVFMDYRNADGGIVEMCGNGVRCVAAYVLDGGVVGGDVVRVGSRAGVRLAEVTGRSAAGAVAETRVDMGVPRPTGPLTLRVPASPRGTEVVATTLSMGNPHAVLVVDDVDKAPVGEWGPHIEHDPAFPDGTNVEFIEVPAGDRVRGRVWERGVGETLASGTGASAMAAAAHLLGLAGRRVRVDVPGGALFSDWTGDRLHLRGPAVEVYRGALSPGWVAAEATAIARD